MMHRTYGTTLLYYFCVSLLSASNLVVVVSILSSGFPTTTLELSPEIAALIPRDVQEKLYHRGITSLLPIQQASFERIYAGRDTVLHSPTGSGKTLAYVLPIVSAATASHNKPSMQRKKDTEAVAASPRILTICPSTELVKEVGKEYFKLLEGSDKDESIGVVTVFEGVPLETQGLLLEQKQPQIVVATPQLLCVLVSKGHIDYSKVSTLVLEEADLLYSSGVFATIADIEKVALDNKKEEDQESSCQKVLVSATIGKNVRDIAQRMTIPSDSFIRIDGNRAASRKNRVYVFREWLLQTYGSYLSRITAEQQQKAKIKSSNKSIIILDVAGGKGDLSWLLNNADGLESVVLDPWTPNPLSISRHERLAKGVEYLRCHPEETRKRSVTGLPTYQPLAALLPQVLKERKKRLPQNRKQKRVSIKDDAFRSEQLSDSSSCCRPDDFVKPQHFRAPLDDEMVNQVRNRIIVQKEKCHSDELLGFDTATSNTTNGKHEEGEEENDEDWVAHNNNTRRQTEKENVLDILSSGRIKLIVAFHPDQATESCIDLARVLNVPFCVVPCCVFPLEFPNRRLRLPIVKEDCKIIATINNTHITRFRRVTSSSGTRTKGLRLPAITQQQPKGNNDDNDNTSNNNRQHSVPVRTYNQFLDYLRQKSTKTVQSTTISSNIPDDDTLDIAGSRRIHTAYLPFSFTETAKNVVLYTMPPIHPIDGGSK